jgi:hypothetical protein
MPEFDAIWDTGATNCVITQSVIDRCGLVPTGQAKVSGVHGEEETRDTYLVNLILPNSVGVQSVRVTKGDMDFVDLLIGMDVIGTGDFAVTNLDGITKFSYRYPSQAHIDFVEEANRTNRAGQFQHGGSANKRTKRPKPVRNKRRK